MKVVYADNWKERMERCEKINCENKKRYTLLKVSLFLGLGSLLLLWWTSADLLRNDIITIFIYVFIGVLCGYVIWTYISGLVADVFDAIILTRGGRHPLFKQIADTGATLSYLIAEKNAVVNYEDEIVYIEYKKIIKGKQERIVLKLENLRKKRDFSIEEPILNLQTIELVVPAVGVKK